ncbi:MAG: fibronectin type III domain-containing protein, partial [Gammaproteobacteria bacterium]
LNITDPNNASPVMNAGLQYGIFPAAISSLTQELAERSGQAPHGLTSTTSIHLAQIGCNDLRFDGKLDGQGYSADDRQITPLAFGTIPLTPQLYRNGIAQHMLKMASSSLNKTGLGAPAFLNIAQSLATMDASVFASLPPESVDLEGPLISINLPANTYIKGLTHLAFTIDDPLGVSKVEYYVDGSLVDTGSAGNTTFSLNTQAYADGAHEIKVLAYDTLNNEGTFARSFNFDNSGPVVTLTSPLLVSNTTYPATGTYQTDGTTVKTILVNGIAAAIDTANNAWSATVPLGVGRNSLVIKAEDTTGNIGPEVAVTVAVDTVKPVITNSNTSASFSTGQNQFNLCNIGTIQTDNPNAVCIRDDRISLNGLAISSDITSFSYVLIGYQAMDAPVDGVFTLREDLLVQYKVNKDGVLFQDWRTAPARNPLNSNWYLPLTTEYLGDTWYQTS